MNDLNIDTIDEIFIYALKEFGFTGIATDIDLVNNKNCSKEVSFYVEKLLCIYKLCISLGIKNFGSWTKIFHNLVNQEADELITYCKSQSGNSLSVNPIGDIFICGYSTSKIGNIAQIDKLFSPKGQYYSLIHQRLPGINKKCYDCSLEGICSGQCLVSSEFSTKDNNRLDFLCNFYKKITTHLLEFKLADELTDLSTF